MAHDFHDENKLMTSLELMVFWHIVILNKFVCLNYIIGLAFFLLGCVQFFIGTSSYTFFRFIALNLQLLRNGKYKYSVIFGK